ncbi:MAG: LysR family transcriptional regulator [Myxococcaceae bacterium]|nr:LysR family transcriptional regulator [Myxococcaceae bacterium]
MASPPVHLLPTFLAVAEHRSFTRAASALALSTSAVSQAVRALEAHVGVPLLHRTTRSVSVTEAGQRLAEAAAPALRDAVEALSSAAAAAGEVLGQLRLNVPAIVVETVVGPLVTAFLARHPRAKVDVWVDDRLVDIVAERFDAGVRLSEAMEKDMVSVRLSEPFRFVVVGSPGYLDARGRPSHPRQLGQHTLIGYRSPTTGAPYRWELERGAREWEVPVDGPVWTNHDGVMLELASRGVGLAYVAEPSARRLLEVGALEVVLDAWAPRVPGSFLYFPSRAQASPTLRAFIACAKQELEARRPGAAGAQPPRRNAERARRP